MAMMLERLGTTPDLIFVYATEHLASSALISAIRTRAPQAQIIGGTTVHGVMTEQGFHSGPHGALGLLGVADPEGDYGVAAAEIGPSPFDAAVAALRSALVEAGRDDETPALVWCCTPPGVEESAIAGVQSLIGTRTPIVGGSSADELIMGRWRQFSQAGVVEDHVIVAALFPSAPFGAAIQGGYAPTEFSGVVTKSDGRKILQIDHRPAAEVYSAWTEGAVAATDVGVILAQSTPLPLGRIVHERDGLQTYVLSHPARIGPSGELALFTDISQGDRICLMQGSKAALIRRAGLVVQDAQAIGGWSREQTLGGMVIYCGGCLLHVGDRIGEVAAQVAQAMDGAPFLGVFTYGEQGPVGDHGNRHGNLMVAALTFGP